MSLEKPVFWGFRTRSHTNRAVQPQIVVRVLRFWIKEVEGFYYLCSKNNGAVQLQVFQASVLCLCFGICKSRFSCDSAQISV